MKLYKYKEYPDESDGYILASTGRGKTWQTVLLCLKRLAPSEKDVAVLNNPQSTPEHVDSTIALKVPGQSGTYVESTS